MTKRAGGRLFVSSEQLYLTRLSGTALIRPSINLLRGTMGSRTLYLIIVMATCAAIADLISILSRCPGPCQLPGLYSPEWTYYHDLRVLKTCNETVIFETNLYNAFNDTKSHIGFRACTAQNSAPGDLNFVQVLSRQDKHDPVPEVQKRSNTVKSLSWGQIISNVDTASISSAFASLQRSLALNGNISSLFVSRRNVVIGFYAGPGIEIRSAAKVVDVFAHTTGPFQSRRAVQWCGNPDRSTNTQSFGLILDFYGDIPAIQTALANWSSGACLQGDQSGEAWWPASSPSILTTMSLSNSGIHKRRLLNGRATCKYIQAKPGDGCWALARRCGITEEQLESYNGGASFCDSMTIGQYVCCSSGSLPDFSPQPVDGKCYAYTIQAQDTCASVAEAHNIMKVAVIEDNNNQTWGWMGCSDLQIGQNICLSPGSPPFPVNIPNAVCGPQVNGTTPTSDPSTWSGLNPCLLNACCDIWGQCGITSEFCMANPADTKAPGTAQPGSNGCISNCGTDIVTSTAPDSFIRVGYFEAWNTERPCLNMWPQSIPAYYTHVHFAFANISSDYNVDISAVGDMFKQFKAKTGFKHILSFGGWSFSTSPETYPIFRQGVTPAQRQTFASNVAKFIMDNDIEGVDFDWEYPGAPDIPGIPPGHPDDGANYLDFLKRVRAVLPGQYSISIAAPASYWYLKGFPIAAISDVVDYIIYMTYDLHGQWDYGNPFSNPGCPEGSCLRSHINRTEIQQSLSMITKAGVPSRKIMVGLPLYGRSFKMSQPGCYTELCTFTGPDSGAIEGKCTDTAGYISNWEIQQILETPGNDAQQYFSNVAGDIVVYNGTQYISYMTTATYNSRLQWAQSLNFGGVSDWALDLETSYYGNGTEVGTGSGVVYVDPSIFTEPDATISCEPPCTFVLPPWTLSEATVITQPPITKTILRMYVAVHTLTSDVISTLYVSVTTVTTITLPPLTTDKIEFWNVEWTSADDTIIYFTSSVVFPPVVLTEIPGVITTDSRSTTLAGIIYTYSPGPYPEPSPIITPGPPPGPPPVGMKGFVHVAKGKPKRTCVSGCGSACKFNCKPGIDCLGICGCIGLGCPAGGLCIGPGCGSEPDDNDSKPSCSTAHTVTDCQVYCSNTDFGLSTTRTCYSTSCVTVEACSTTGFTTTSETTTFSCPWTTALISAIWRPDDPEGRPPVLGGGGEFGYVHITGASVRPPSPTPTNFINCGFHGQDPDQGLTAQYCVCSGSTFPVSTNTAFPGESCAYTKLPTKTTDISTLKETVTSGCEVCTYAGINVDCSTIEGCVQSTSTTTPAPATATVTPTADCAFWDKGWGWRFEVYNIAHWATDGGFKLHHEENGCGALTGWDWHSASPESYPFVYFNLPFWIKDGCVERAIVSAGGPKLGCKGHGLDIKGRGWRIGGAEGDETPNSSAIKETRAAMMIAASYKTPSSTPTYTYPVSLTSTPRYIPMTWDMSPVTPTSTFVSKEVNVLTTVALITTTSVNVPSKL
ncbi:class 5 chitinase 1 [Daldinia sp. FL1419]|nr:class 5 chitinase 1 [Daldinia sp. FL1419]